MQEIDCQCGKKHSLNCDEIVVDKDALSLLLQKVENSKALLLTDQFGLDELEGRVIGAKHINLPSFTATVAFAESLPDKGQDVVVAIGQDQLISLAKYYAYKYSCQLYIYPLGNFADFTFSSFARLYDGVEMGFYKAAQPNKIFVCPPTSVNSLQAYYMSTKFLTMFDNLVASMVFGKSECQKAEEFFKTAMKSYLAPCRPEEESSHLVWSLIRLGQGMTYFGQTKFFLGAERPVAELMTTLRPKSDYLEMVSVAHKLVLNAYCCFFPSPPSVGQVNLSKHINSLAELLKVPPSLVIGRLAESSTLLISEQTKRKFLAYQPYLKRIFTRLTSRAFALQAKVSLAVDGLKKNGFTLPEVEKCFALSPLTSGRTTGMNLILGFGYLDKLL